MWNELCDVLYSSLVEYFDVCEMVLFMVCMEKVELVVGMLLFCKGDVGDLMYFIDEGMVSILLLLEGGGCM